MVICNFVAMASLKNSNIPNILFSLELNKTKQIRIIQQALCSVKEPSHYCFCLFYNGNRISKSTVINKPASRKTATDAGLDQFFKLLTTYCKVVARLATTF